MKKIARFFHTSYRALTHPAEVGAELRDDYWLTPRDMAMMVLTLVVTGRLLQWVIFYNMPEAQNAPHFSPLTDMVLGILGIVFAFVMYWFVVPAFDKWGYHMLGVRLTYAQARQVNMANYFVSLSPVLIIMILLAILAFKLVSSAVGVLLFLVLGLIVIVQSVRLRKHLLEISATKAFFAPTIIPALIALLLIVIGFFVGVSMLHKMQGSRAEPEKTQHEQVTPVEPPTAVVR